MYCLPGQATKSGKCKQYSYVSSSWSELVPRDAHLARTWLGKPQRFESAVNSRSWRLVAFPLPFPIQAVINNAFIPPDLGRWTYHSSFKRTQELQAETVSKTALCLRRLPDLLAIILLLRHRQVSLCDSNVPAIHAMRCRFPANGDMTCWDTPWPVYPLKLPFMCRNNFECM